MMRFVSIWGAHAMIMIENVCPRVHGMLISRNAETLVSIHLRCDADWTLVRIYLRCDANHNLSLCARPGFDSALNLYIDTFIKICLQCFRSISRF